MPSIAGRIGFCVVTTIEDVLDACCPIIVPQSSVLPVNIAIHDRHHDPGAIENKAPWM